MGKTFLNAVVYAGAIMAAFGIGTIYGKLDAVEAFVKRTDDDRAHDRFTIPVMFGIVKIESVDKTWVLTPTESIETEE